MTKIVIVKKIEDVEKIGPDTVRLMWDLPECPTLHDTNIQILYANYVEVYDKPFPTSLRELHINGAIKYPDHLPESLEILQINNVKNITSPLPKSLISLCCNSVKELKISFPNTLTYLECMSIENKSKIKRCDRIASLVSDIHLTNRFVSSRVNYT